jgi:hypothetical protein
MPLAITSRISSNVVIVDINGRLCILDVTLREHMTELLEEGHRAFVLNLANVPYVDSFGLGQLITICGLPPISRTPKRGAIMPRRGVQWERKVGGDSAANSNSKQSS